MARVNGKKPPATMAGMNDIDIRDCYFIIEASKISVGSRVAVRMKSGEVVEGILTNHCDWLVGCPVVTTDSGEAIGIGYYGDIIGKVTGEKK